MAREPQFSRLPLIWKKLDKHTILERFLNVEDTELNATRQKIQDLLSARDITQIPDRFLKIIGYVVGHRWKDYRSYSWNRQRISELINKYSYKGSDACLSDLVYEYGGDWYKVIDMASMVGVYDRQASMTQFSHYYDSDFFHQGVYQLWLPDNMDIEHFLEDFEYIKPAGTRWIIRLCIADCHTSMELLDYATPILLEPAAYDYTYKIYDMLFGFYNHIPQPAWEPTVHSTVWSYVSSSWPNIYGQAFYNFSSQRPTDPVAYEVVWPDIRSGFGINIYGGSPYNFSLQLPTQPTVLLSSDYLGIANALIDLSSISFRWDGEEFNFDSTYIPLNYNWKQPLVEPIILT